ncbi:hypothetical protein VTL71DRAFT_5326 [Oculimacula yallundae]|uniref:glucan endo-1,3-beta-D-glucosidase n=1 Tax=Oculimacula yallundae TaxID=86028 RepID=A0ABR4C0S6_9HELO
MKSTKVNLALLLAILVMLFGLAAGDLCQKGVTKLEGNYYCQAVKGVRYKNVGHAGSYEDIVSMPKDGTCGTKTKYFNGRLSPFDEELSLHVRGPAAIKQIAVYLPCGSGQKAEKRAHGHTHAHLKKAHHNDNDHKLAKKDQVIATIDGQVVSWENNWFGSSAEKASTTLVTQALKKPADGVEVASTTEITLTVTTYTTTCTVSQVTGNDASKSTATPTSDAMPTTTSVNDKPTDNKNAPSHKHSYKRIGYYESSSQTAENLVFLSNFGGQNSGVFDLTYGASLAYANSNVTSGSPTPQILADTLIKSRNEVIITTDKKCDNHDCGFVRPGAVAYHGFDGPEKVFLIEVGMPSDGDTGPEGNQPAIWLLNSKIPRTMQYGRCSCWPACGELDIAEALSVGSRYMKSTVHAQASGGDSDYFNRPVQGTATILTVLRKDEIFIGVIPDMKFPDKFNDFDLEAWMDIDDVMMSDFTIA